MLVHPESPEELHTYSVDELRKRLQSIAGNFELSVSPIEYVSKSISGFSMVGGRALLRTYGWCILCVTTIFLSLEGTGSSRSSGYTTTHYDAPRGGVGVVDGLLQSSWRSEQSHALSLDY